MSEDEKTVPAPGKHTTTDMRFMLARHINNTQTGGVREKLPKFILATMAMSGDVLAQSRLRENRPSPLL